MPVCELAIINLELGCDRAQLIETCKACFREQDIWVKSSMTNFVPEGENVSTAYLDDNRLYITATWLSPVSHHSWILSKPNATGMATLKPYFKSGADAMTLFHLDNAIPGRNLTDIQLGPAVQITRIGVTASNMGTLQLAYDCLRKLWQRRVDGPAIWAGWRIEKIDEMEELVVFWNDQGMADAIENLALLGDYKENHSVARLE